MGSSCCRSICCGSGDFSEGGTGSGQQQVIWNRWSIADWNSISVRAQITIRSAYCQNIHTYSNITCPGTPFHQHQKARETFVSYQLLMMKHVYRSLIYSKLDYSIFTSIIYFKINPYNTQYIFICMFIHNKTILKVGILASKTVFKKGLIRK
jgi:hypothetical protein